MLSRRRPYQYTFEVGLVRFGEHDARSTWSTRALARIRRALPRSLPETGRRDRILNTGTGGRVSKERRQSMRTLAIVDDALTETGEMAGDDPHQEDIYLAAVAHDLYEDTAIKPERIREHFGGRVDSYIEGMTNHVATRTVPSTWPKWKARLSRFVSSRWPISSITWPAVPMECMISEHDGYAAHSCPSPER